MEEMVALPRALLDLSAKNGPQPLKWASQSNRLTPRKYSGFSPPPEGGLG